MASSPAWRSSRCCSPGGVRLPERPPARPRSGDGTPVARSPRACASRRPPYHSPNLARRLVMLVAGGGLTVVIGIGAGDDRRLRPGVHRRDAHRPAEEVTVTSAAPRRDRAATWPRPGTPATSTSPGRHSSTPTPSYGRRRSARWSASACSTTRRWPAALADATRRRAAPRRRRVAAAPPGGRPAGGRSPTPTPAVVEMAAWACGEHEDAVRVRRRARSVALAVRARRRRSCARRPWPRSVPSATTGAWTTILAATNDKPAIRRRAVLALAPFVDPEHPRAADVAAALEAAATDRDWQVRQAAEDLTAATDPTTSVLNRGHGQNGREPRRPPRRSANL